MNADCKYSMNNTGVGCFPLIKAALMYIAVPTYNSLGQKNYIDLADAPFDETYFSGKINAADPSERWYPLPALKNPSDKRGDSLTQSFDDGSFVIIEEGARQIMSLVVGKDASPVFYKQLKTFRNIDFSIFVITIDKNLVGMKLDTNDYIYPIRIDKDSFDPIYNPGTSKELQAIAIKANYHKSMQDDDLTMLASDEMDYDPSLLRGLLSVDAVFSSLNDSPGGFTVELNTEYGTMTNPQRVSGLVAADFALYNVTGSSSITITTVTEQTDGDGNGTGVYVFTFPNQTANDVVKLTPTKNGFDFAKVIAQRPVLV